MRPIDSDVLLEKLSTECEYADDCKKTEPCITCIINGCPTLDVEPIKHGHWICEDLQGGFGKITCSRCREEINVSQERYENLKEYEKFCASCGAKMDGEPT